MTFSPAIFHHRSVKHALITAQHNKCAFCETRWSRFYGDVEHFRPKQAWRQKLSDPLSTCGYYWLAYRWENVFLSCQFCNQRFKRNLFPLSNPARRARSHHDDVSKEKPLLIDPAVDDPAKLIGFREQYAYSIGGNRRAKATIDLLGLNDDALAEERFDLLKQVYLLHESAILLQDRQNHPGAAPSSKERSLLAEIEAQLISVTDASAEYSAMIRAALA